MSKSKPLRCQKCGKPIGYVSIIAQSFSPTTISVDNVKLIATCLDCSNGNSLYRRNF